MKSLLPMYRFLTITLILVLSVPAVLAKATDAITISLAQPLLSCSKQQAKIALSWNTTGPIDHVNVSRLFSWREGWENVAENLTDTSIVDSPKYIAPQTYTYKVTSVVDGKKYTSNVVRISVAPCFPTLIEEKVVLEDPEVLLLREIPKNLWGATVGYNTEDIDSFEKLVGAEMTTSSAEVFWGNENDFPIDLADAFEDKTMVLFWNPGDYNSEAVDDPRFSYNSILSGSWDTYIEKFAVQVQEYGKPVILVPFPEMNGDWYTWGGTVNGNTAESHVAAYRYIHRFFKDVPNVLFGWSVNNESIPDIGTNSIVGYYPGSNYVDIVGVSGYNYANPWQNFHDVFAPALYTFQIFQKPVMIFGMGSAEGERKAEWIQDAINVQTKLYSEIIGWLWNNMPYDENYNWRVESSPASLDAFRTAIQK